MFPFLRGIREAVRGFYETLTRGTLRRLSLALIGRTPLVRRFGIEPALRRFGEERSEVWKFGPRGYDWVTVETLPSAIGKPIARNQMHVADVVVVGPDGQFITINNLFWPTGRAWDKELFTRRLAAELKRMERGGEIHSIGADATGYVLRSTVEYNLYTMTRV